MEKEPKNKFHTQWWILLSLIVIIPIFYFLTNYGLQKGFGYTNNPSSVNSVNEVKTSEMLKAEQDAQAIADEEQARANAEQAKADAEWGASKAGQICKAHPGWDRTSCENLANRKMWIGMTYEMLEYGRGPADTKNVSNYGQGDEYQWCWDGYTPSCVYGGSDGVITSYN